MSFLPFVQLEMETRLSTISEISLPLSFESVSDCLVNVSVSPVSSEFSPCWCLLLDRSFVLFLARHTPEILGFVIEKALNSRWLRTPLDLRERSSWSQTIQSFLSTGGAGNLSATRSILLILWLHWWTTWLGISFLQTLVANKRLSYELLKTSTVRFTDLWPCVAESMLLFELTLLAPSSTMENLTESSHHCLLKFLINSLASNQENRLGDCLDDDDLIEQWNQQGGQFLLFPFLSSWLNSPCNHHGTRLSLANNIVDCSSNRRDCCLHWTALDTLRVQMVSHPLVQRENNFHRDNASEFFGQFALRLLQCHSVSGSIRDRFRRWTGILPGVIPNKLLELSKSKEQKVKDIAISMEDDSSFCRNCNGNCLFKPFEYLHCHVSRHLHQKISVSHKLTTLETSQRHLTLVKLFSQLSEAALNLLENSIHHWQSSKHLTESSRLMQRPSVLPWRLTFEEQLVYSTLHFILNELLMRQNSQNLFALLINIAVRHMALSGLAICYETEAILVSTLCVLARFLIRVEIDYRCEFLLLFESLIVGQIVQSTSSHTDISDKYLKPLKQLVDDGSLLTNALDECKSEHAVLRRMCTCESQRCSQCILVRIREHLCGYKKAMEHSNKTTLAGWFPAVPRCWLEWITRSRENV